MCAIIFAMAIVCQVNYSWNSRSTVSFGNALVPHCMRSCCVIVGRPSVRDVKASRPMWPRGQIIRPRLQPHSFWPRSHGNWPRGLESSAHGKDKVVFPCSLPSVGPGADPGVQAVSPQVT